jgi:hypothetical protein
VGQIVGDALVCHHPRGCYLATKLDQRRDFIEVIRQVPPKNRLVVGDAVPQESDVFEGGVNLQAQCVHGLISIEIRQHAPKVNIPKAHVVAPGKHLLPKHKFQFRYDFAGRELLLPVGD